MQKITQFFKEVFYFFTSFPFYKHLILMVLCGGLILVGLFSFLNWYTLHEESIEVPSVVGLSTQDAERLLSTRSLKLQVIDERDDENKPRSSILEQFPQSGQKVKESRTIYIVVNAAKASNVQLYYKSVIGVPLSTVEQKLANLKLKVKDIQLIDGRGENTVAEVRLNDRILLKEADPTRGIRPPSAPAEIPKGSAVTLVVYRGENNKLRPVPDVMCQTFSAAELSIKGSQFIMGDHIFEAEVVDSAGAYVVSQDPLPNAMYLPGTPVRLKLAKEQPKLCEDLGY